jgi:hypothetical protein
MKAQWDEGGGRILLGDNNLAVGHAAAGQVPVGSVWISAGLLGIYTYI